MKYKIGETISPKADHNIAHIIEGIEPAKYRCHWFVNGEIHTGLLQETNVMNGERQGMGFGEREIT